MQPGWNEEAADIHYGRPQPYDPQSACCRSVGTHERIRKMGGTCNVCQAIKSAVEAHLRDIAKAIEKRMEVPARAIRDGLVTGQGAHGELCSYWWVLFAMERISGIPVRKRLATDPEQSAPARRPSNPTPPTEGGA